MTHTCEGYTIFTVKMSIADWDSVEFFYQKFNDDGALAWDTKHVSCTDDAANDRTCTFNVGNIPNHEEIGLPSARQPVMGWRAEAGDYGIKS